MNVVCLTDYAYLCTMAKKDINQLAKFIGDQATDEATRLDKNPAAVELGRLGGLKGGKARAATLSAERRKEIAQIAAKKRWGNSEKQS